MDARRARHVHRNAAPKSPGRSFTRLCQLSKCVPEIRSVLSPAPDGGDRSGRPYDGLRPRAPATRSPAPQAGASSSPQTVPKPRTRPPRQLRGPAGWRPGTKSPSSLAARLPLAAPAPPGSLRAVPAPGAPAGRGGRLRPGPRSGAGRFLTNFPPSSSPLWAKKEGEAPTPFHSHTPHTSTLPVLERRGDLSEGERTVPSPWTLQGSSPLPPPPWAPMIRSPAHFERLLGSPAAKEDRSGAQEGPSATAACGVASNLTAALQSAPPSHPLLSSAGDWGREEIGKCGARGMTGGRRGPWKSTGLERGARPFRPRCAHLPGRAERPFPAAGERFLRHFIFIIVSVDTCSS